MNDVFKQNPKLEKYYSTSDGEAFYNENDAKNHAKSLDEKTVETVYNDDFLEANDIEDLSDDKNEMAEFEAAEKLAADKKAQEAAAKPVVIDLSKMSKAKLLAYAEEQKLTIVDPTATNAVLVEEISNQLPKNKE
jgi:hypothetical protein